MRSKVELLVTALLYQICVCSGQRQWVPPTTTAAEMWNPYTWYWPYAIAAAEGYRDYFQNAQQITNQLYMQAYNTNAFWWTNNRPGGQAGGAVGQATGQGGQAAGQATGQGGQAAGQATGQGGQAAGQATGQGGQATGQGGQAAGQATGQGGQAAGQATGQGGQAAGQGGQTAGQTTGQGGQATGGATNNQFGSQPVPNMSQGGSGWS